MDKTDHFLRAFFWVPVLLASFFYSGEALAGPDTASPASVSVFATYGEKADLPFRAGFGLAAAYHFSQRAVLSASYHYQSGYGKRTGYAYLDNLPVLQNVLNVRAEYTVYRNGWMAVTPFAAYNYLAYGDLHNNAAGIGFNVLLKPCSWLRLKGQAEALAGFDGNIAGLNLTRPANLYQFKGTAEVPVGWKTDVFSAVEFSRYIGESNTLTGYTVYFGVTRHFAF